MRLSPVSLSESSKSCLKSDARCEMLNTINTASPQAVSDTQLGEEVHEEGTVEVFAHLVEHKPVSQFAVINESPNLFHLC